jgi:hypothetical protein
MMNGAQRSFMAKKKSNSHNLHAVMITFSVIAGLALAACQPKMMENQQTSPTPSALPAGGAVNEQSMQYGTEQGSATAEVDTALKEMDSAMKVDPSVSGSDLQ